MVALLLLLRLGLHLCAKVCSILCLNLAPVAGTRLLLLLLLLLL
jgi:hypothetical protein